MLIIYTKKLKPLNSFWKKNIHIPDTYLQIIYKNVPLISVTAHKMARTKIIPNVKRKKNSKKKKKNNKNELRKIQHQ